MRVKKAPAITTGTDEPVEVAERQVATLQTLDRGLQVLSILSRETDGATVATIAAQLGVHRVIAYRLIATLERHALISRGADGQVRLGGGILVLANRFIPQLRAIAQRPLQVLAEKAEATAFLSIAEGRECVAIQVSEPDDMIIRAAYKVGSRHPVESGAAGIAILSARPPHADDPEPVRIAREAGFAVTRGAIQKGAIGIASPIRLLRDGAHSLEASVGVVAIGELAIESIAIDVMDCARKIASAIGG